MILHSAFSLARSASPLLRKYSRAVYVFCMSQITLQRVDTKICHVFISKLRYCASVLVLVACTLGIENSSRNNNNQIQVIQCKLSQHLRTVYACFSVWLIAGFWYGCWRYNTLTCQFFQAIHGLRIAPGLRHIHLSNHSKLPGFDTYIWSKISPNLPGFAHTSALNLKIFPGPGNIHFGWFSGVLLLHNEPDPPVGELVRSEFANTALL